MDWQYKLQKPRIREQASTTEQRVKGVDMTISLQNTWDENAITASNQRYAAQVTGVKKLSISRNKNPESTTL